MPEFKPSIVVTVLVLGLSLLLQFNQDIVLPKWLTPFGLGGLLALLMLMLPWMQKGSPLAFVVGYLAIAFLMINLTILFTLAHLPGKTVKLSSASRKAGSLLLEIVGAGFGVLLQTLIRLAGQGIAQMTAVMLNAIDKRTKGTAAQKLLGTSLAWG